LGDDFLFSKQFSSSTAKNTIDDKARDNHKFTGSRLSLEYGVKPEHTLLHLKTKGHTTAPKKVDIENNPILNNDSFSGPYGKDMSQLRQAEHSKYNRLPMDMLCIDGPGLGKEHNATHQESDP